MTQQVKDELVKRVIERRKIHNREAREIWWAFLEEKDKQKAEILLKEHDLLSIKIYRLCYMEAILQIGKDAYHNLIWRIPVDLYKPEIDLSLTI